MLNDLCCAFRDGFPIENMRPLLVSDDARVTASAAFIAYELGSMMCPFLGELVALADHVDAQSRSDIIYALTECAGPDDLDALSRIMLAFDDRDPFVHRSAIQFVIVASDRSVGSAVTEAARRFPRSPFEDVLFVLGEDRSRLDSRWERITAAKLTELIGHEEAIVRRFGVGLAARPKLVVDVGFLEIARNCRDTQGLAVINHVMWSPTLKRSRLANVKFLESGLERGEPLPVCRQGPDTESWN